MWTYDLANLDGTPVGEISNAVERTLTLGLNKPATASFTIRPDNEMMPYLFGGDRLLKVYEDGVLRFYGNIISSEYSSGGDESGNTVRCNAANPAWRLNKRLLGISKGGTIYEGDKAKIARKMINELNTDTATYPLNLYTGIELLEEAAYFAGSTGKYVAGPYQTALSCINDLAHNITGFDWYIAPVDGKGTTIGVFEANNSFGDPSKAIFEHGSGSHNVRSLTFTRDLSDLVNNAYHLPDDGLEAPGAEVRNKQDTTSITTHGRYETVADAFGLSDVALRDAWLEEVIRVKKNPRYVASMTLDIDDGTGRVPKLGTDFWLGDTVEARSVVEKNTMFDGLVRIYAVNISIAQSGTETITPILLDEEGE